jgi:hypothetical protein
MLWFILITVIAFIGFKFFISSEKDNDDLQNRTLADKFETIVNKLNEVAFGGEGKVTTINKSEFNLYKSGDNQIIKFQYSTGIFTIIWKYKYFQKEIIHQRDFDNARNLSIFEQDKIAQNFIKEMDVKVRNHKSDVLSAPTLQSKPVTILERNASSGIIISNTSVNNIVLNNSTFVDVIKAFGPHFKTANGGTFSQEMIYPELGVSFHFKNDDVFRKIFKIDAKYPFSGSIEAKFRIGKTTLKELIAVYGHPVCMPIMEGLAYYKVNNMHFGIKPNSEDFSAQGFHYENHFNTAIIQIRLI